MIYQIATITGYLTVLLRVFYPIHPLLLPPLAILHFPPLDSDMFLSSFQSCAQAPSWSTLFGWFALISQTIGAIECMRSMTLVDFRMALKKLYKGKEKEVTSTAPTLDDRWLMSKCTESNILSLVKEDLLQSRSIVFWRSALGHRRPYEQTDEVVAFTPFVERGFAVPTCNFIRGLL